ncbi:MAE_28990/MAE_18760 family HEPN-like nuclease [Bacillus sp. SRB_331]|uniref:MAE_28990/MAE_18760 family HEPN-like nuclease n=1 Tax=Bacillus sp. SRB_331 TaxID=1969379 RepID=UPI000DC53757|nr:MAE_28990/MAE_18760 family HEPN-like nuclease [Bacillus sp. SRB_331]RAN80579.1 hypothetical protein B5P42_13590 [Bacillus sp. SRB_331]
MLFRIGLPFENFSEYEIAIKTLLNRRNNIAHGTEGKGISEEEYTQVKEATFGIMNGLIHLIMDALKEKKFLKVIEN